MGYRLYFGKIDKNKYREVKDLNRKEDLKQLRRTKEFTTLCFKGEDGTESSYQLNYGWDRNSNDKDRQDITHEVYRFTEETIENKIKEMEEDVIELVNSL